MKIKGCSFACNFSANTGYSDEADACLLSGLPEFYSDLGEAWLAVGWVNASSTTLNSSTVTRFGNPCGSTKKSYCSLQMA